ncbi:unnamed protein product [Musa textilis]
MNARTYGGLGKGTGSFGKRRNTTHTLCVSRRAAAAPADYPSGRIRKCDSSDPSISLLLVTSGFCLLRWDLGCFGSGNWSVKAIRRKTTGTGRMRYLRHVPRRFKSSFREGCSQATPMKKAVAEA